ncbi:MAG: beta-lactamase family protein [Caldilineaceae bacterium]|nr:beta-lactamase family protein [Caldilineaceae bacterium]
MNPPAFVSLIDRYLDEGGFAGAALIAAQHGRIVIEHYAGMAAPGVPASPTVLWPLASISKVYTAAMIMRLVEAGTLTLNRLAHQLLPQFTGEGRETIRLRHLLTHTAGMIYESPEMAERLAAQTPATALIEEMLAAPLLFKPGTAFAYADYHYLLAGCMAAAATGIDFAELVDTLVLQPMGLHDTYLRPPTPVYNRLAKVRGVMAEETAGAMYNSSYALSLAHPAFGTVATARDLLHFALHFAPTGPRLHSAAAVRTMTTDQTGGFAAAHDAQMGLPAGMYVPWGIGFALKNSWTPSNFADLASQRAYGHGGASGCQLVIDPAADAVIALMTNTHARTGRELWYTRLQSILNSAFACLA